MYLNLFNLASTKRAVFCDDWDLLSQLIVLYKNELIKFTLSFGVWQAEMLD